MASETSVPGADEFVPALVYVVIHANPPGLLSTVQYVTNFYDQRLSGEEAYYWMQFSAAIAFIKTLTYSCKTPDGNSVRWSKSWQLTDLFVQQGIPRVFLLGSHSVSHPDIV